jgi:hypothetical protein
MCHWLLLASTELSLLLLHRPVTHVAGRTTAATVTAAFGGWELPVLLHSPMGVVRSRAPIRSCAFQCGIMLATRSPRTPSSVGCEIDGSLIFCVVVVP